VIGVGVVLERTKPPRCASVGFLVEKTTYREKERERERVFQVFFFFFFSVLSL
jgi:hypothetical protein|tara:strand:+ start:375 stop:533 length:159 start_codon:yes stop_codon:yes gene_type:complete